MLYRWKQHRLRRFTASGGKNIAKGEFDAPGSPFLYSWGPRPLRCRSLRAKHPNCRSTVRQSSFRFRSGFRFRLGLAALPAVGKGADRIEVFHSINSEAANSQLMNNITIERADRAQKLDHAKRPCEISSDLIRSRYRFRFRSRWVYISSTSAGNISSKSKSKSGSGSKSKKPFTLCGSAAQTCSSPHSPPQRGVGRCRLMNNITTDQADTSQSRRLE
mgnify:CR=1 FL=1